MSIYTTNNTLWSDGVVKHVDSNEFVLASPSQQQECLFKINQLLIQKHISFKFQKAISHEASLYRKTSLVRLQRSISF